MTVNVLLPSCSINQDDIMSSSTKSITCRSSSNQRFQTSKSNDYKNQDSSVSLNQNYYKTEKVEQNEQSSQEVNQYFSNKNNKANHYETTYVKNTVAQAVITRLHRWCCQLFWLTIVCVMGCCGELQKTKSKTIAEVRRNIFNNNLRRCKDLNDLEVQLLRHLTKPQNQSMVVRPLRTSTLRRRPQLSRPPSPQLFAIFENEEAE